MALRHRGATMALTLIALMAAVLLLPGFYAVTGVLFAVLGIVVFAVLLQKYPFSTGTTGNYYLGEGVEINKGTIKKEVE